MSTAEMSSGKSGVDFSAEPTQGEDDLCSIATKPNKRRSKEQELPLKADDITHFWLSKRFAQLNEGRLRYCKTWGTWLVYKGGRWLADDRNAPKAMVVEMIESLHQVIDQIRGLKRRQEFKKALRHAGTSVATVNSILNLANADPRLVVSPECFDQDDSVLNCLNGTIDLVSLKLKPHDPADMLTNRAPVSFDPKAKCPRWDAFLKRIMADDEEMITYLQRVAGYAFTGDVSHQCLFLFYGDGQNGKSVFMNALLEIAGSYGMTGPNHLLTSAGQNSHPTIIADLEGKRIACISEPSGGRFDEPTLKMLTGGDNVRARRICRDSREFRPTHKFIVSSNHRPRVVDASMAMRRRIKLIHFKVTIPPSEVDRDLPKKLRAELPGILNWILEGSQWWLQTRDLCEPEAVSLATLEYMDEADIVARFIREKCVTGKDNKVAGGMIYEAFKGWCDETGIDQNERHSLVSFFKRLDGLGYHSRKSNGTKMRYGIALKTEDNLEELEGSRPLETLDNAGFCRTFAEGS